MTELTINALPVQVQVMVTKEGGNVAYWVKITYERNKYVIDLDRIAAFCCAPNGRISFSLPDTGTTITLSKHGDVEDYQKIIDYIEKTTGSPVW